MPGLRELPKQALAQWQALPRRVRIGAIGAVAVLLAGIGYLATTGAQVDYAPLYAGLGAEDAGAVVDKLREMKVPYQLDRGGELIQVPRAQVAEIRLGLASQGLPRGGTAGFELFDKQSLGVSDFAQHVNYHRALEGELARSIGTLAAVQRARVHLVVPERNLFRTEADQPSASVVVQLHAGRTLDGQQVQGIVHLVSSSVAGLRPDRVTIIDGRGDVLSQAGASAAPGAVLKYQQEIEETARKRAQELLEKTVGKGHAAVQVSALVDPAQLERTEEEYNPDQQVVRSEQKVEDTVGPAGGESEGVTGARANLPGGPPPQVTPTGGSRRRSETTNYEIGKTLRKLTQPMGKLERLTVAVVVDGSYQLVEPGGKGHGAKERKFVPRTKEELDAYAAIVKEAVGFDAKRGDQIEVRCVPFAPDALGEGEEAPVSAATFPAWLAALGTALAMLLAGAGAVFWLRRRQQQQLEVLADGVRVPLPLRQLEETLTGMPRAALAGQGGESGPTPQALRQQTLDALHEHPERAVHVLTAWIHEPEPTLEAKSLDRHDEHAQRA